MCVCVCVLWGVYIPRYITATIHGHCTPNNHASPPPPSAVCC